MSSPRRAARSPPSPPAPTARTRAAAVATSSFARLSRSAVASEGAVFAAYALGALLLAGEAAVHIQQYASFIHGVRWIGPLFLANALACVAAIAGLAYPRTRQLAGFRGW